MGYQILILLWGFLFQFSPNLENQIAEEIILQYLESRENTSPNKTFFVSEILDSVFVRRYKHLLNTQNYFIYNGLSNEEKEMIQNLLQIKEPVELNLNKLTEGKKFNIRPLKEFVRDDWQSSTIRLSRISISPSGIEACLILEYLCGSKCGLGVLIFAQKENESWKMSLSRRLWVA